MGDSLSNEIEEICSYFKVLDDNLFFKNNLIGNISNDIINRNEKVLELVISLLYRYAYCKSDVPPDATKEDLILKDSLLEVLSASNFTVSKLESGWTIVEILNSQLFILEKNGRHIRLPAHECVFLPHGPKIGDYIQVAVQKEKVELNEHFYYAFSQTKEGYETAFSVRIYFNVTAEGSSILMAAITKTLNQFIIPFIFKTLRYRNTYVRNDSAVLYITKDHFNITNLLLEHHIYPVIMHYLKPGTPMFTFKLRDGVGFAESPINGDSFGISRCRIIAEILFGIFSKNNEQSEWPALILKGLIFNNVNLTKPFLNADSNYSYSFLQL